MRLEVAEQGVDFVFEDILCRSLLEVVLVTVKLDVDDDTERLKREVEAIAYVVGRYCGLNTTGSVFYLAAWESDDPEVVRDRLGRISRTTKAICSVLED